MESFCNSIGWLPLLLQTGDAQFPTGAYAHSLGLEEMVRLGVVRDEETLLEFLRGQIVPALTRFELPHVRFAWDAAQIADVATLAQLDDELAAWKICRELREASRQLGERRLHALRQIETSPFIDECAARLPWKHHAVVCGIQFRAMPLEAGLMAYFYQSLSGFCSAALKLIRIGQEGCQRTLRAALELCEKAVSESMAIARDEAGWFNPLLEIASMRHERANERLFIS